MADRPAPAVRRKLKGAPLVLSGTVAEPDPSVPPHRREEGTVFAVTQTLRAHESFGDLAGQRILVKLKAPAKAGDNMVLLAESWFYGAWLGVRELGRLDPSELDSIAEEAQRQDREAPLERLRDQATRADLVVVGDVRKLEPLDPQRDRVPLSEHDPHWWIASLDVLEVIAGKAVRKVDVAYANSRDVRWSESPKPHAGQHAIWLLRRQKLPEVNKTYWTIVDQDQIQPLEHRDEVTKSARRKARG
jgi:hypothetical protein